MTLLASEEILLDMGSIVHTMDFLTPFMYAIFEEFPQPTINWLLLTPFLPIMENVCIETR